MRRRLQPMAFVLAFSFGEPVGFFLGRFHRIGDRVRLRLTGSLFFFSFFGLFFSFDTVDDVFLAFINEAVEKPRPEETDTIFFFLRLEVLRTKKKLKKTNGNRLYGKPTPPHEVPYLHFFKKKLRFHLTLSTNRIGGSSKSSHVAMSVKTRERPFIPMKTQ